MRASNPPTAFATVSGIARRAGLHRSIIVRLLSHGLIEADALLEIGDAPQPLFRTGAERIAAIQYAATSGRPASSIS